MSDAEMTQDELYAQTDVWVKKNDSEIELNRYPATIAHAKSLGWKIKGKKKAPAKKDE